MFARYVPARNRYFRLKIPNIPAQIGRGLGGFAIECPPNSI